MTHSTVIADEGRPALAVALLLILFRIVLDWSYLVAIAPGFPDEGYSASPEGWRVIVSWVLTLTCIRFAPLEMKRPSDPVGMLLLLTPILPMHTLFAWRGDSAVVTVIGTLAAIVILSIRHVAWPAIRRPTWNVRIAEVIASTGIAVTIVVMVARGGLRVASLDLATVYLLRDAATEQVAGGRLAYLVDWSMKVFVPVLSAAALARGRRSLALSILAIEVPLFALTAQKGPLGFLGLLALIIIVHSLRRPMAGLLLAITAGIAVATLLSIAMDSLAVTSYFTRRVFFVPANLNFAYARYFADAGTVAFSTSLPSWISPYPFALSPAQLVGDFLAPGTGQWANTGFIGTGFMHAGGAGVLLFAVVLGALLGLADQLAEGMLHWAASLVILVPFATVFTSADLPTAMVTHGVALALVFLPLFRADTCGGAS